MTSLDDAVVARIERNGKTFEIFVDPELAWEIRRNEKEFTLEVLAVDDIFKDARSGERPSEDDLLLAFNTIDVPEIAEKIICKGILHLTAEQKRKKAEEKKKQIIEKIAKNAVNPQTGSPHPPVRIESVMDEARVSIDPFLPASEQIRTVVDAIRPILPISFEKKKYRIDLPPQYASKCYGDVKRIAEIVNETWQNDGHLVLTVEIAAGASMELMDVLNKITHGTVMIQEI